MGGCGLVEDISHVLGAVVGDVDTDMRVICREGLTESFLLTLREPITPGAQEKPDVVEGITCAPAVTGRVLLDATAHLTGGVASECDDVTGAAHAGCVLGAGQAMAFLLSRKRIEHRDSHPRTEVFSSLGQPVLVHGARPARHQVHSRGPRRRRSWWCHTPLIDSGYPNPCEAGGVQMRLAGTA